MTLDTIFLKINTKKICNMSQPVFLRKEPFFSHTHKKKKCIAESLVSAEKVAAAVETRHQNFGAYRYAIKIVI